MCTYLARHQRRSVRLCQAGGECKRLRMRLGGATGAEAEAERATYNHIGQGVECTGRCGARLWGRKGGRSLFRWRVRLWVLLQWARVFGGKDAV